MEQGMKIVAGLGEIDAYPEFVKAGADEVFCGYVPHLWNEKFQTHLPANRREVLFYQVQIGTIQEMKILKKMKEKYGTAISVTWNSLSYNQEQLEILGSILKDLVENGIQDFIVADLGLMLYLKKKGLTCNLHISGELGGNNSELLKFLLKEVHTLEGKGPKITRWVFHRKTTWEEMKACIQVVRQLGVSVAFEAFLLNENCHFNGGFCNSMHCDEMVHLCQMPYQLVNLSENKEIELLEREESEQVGSSGCGLCALWKMKEIGITHLKVVGRGKSSECMKYDIEVVKKALTILENSNTENQYIIEMKRQLFPNGCSNHCYYR